MSGPKGYSYTLSAEAQRRLQLQRLRTQWDVQRHTIARMAQAAAQSSSQFDLYEELARRGFSEQTLAAPSDAHLDRLAALNAAVTECRQAWSRAEITVAASEMSTRMDKIRHDLAAQGPLVVTRFTSSALASPVGDSGVPGPSADEVARHQAQLRGRLNEVINLTAELLDTATRAGLIERCETLLTALNEQDLRDLEDDTVAAVRAQRTAQRIQTLRDDLATELMSMAGTPAFHELAQDLDAATTEDELHSLHSRMEQAQIAQAEEAERVFVVQQAKEVWEELGYVADDEFVTATLAGRPALLHRPEWREHALQVRFAGPAQGWSTNIVAFTATSPAREREVEEEHCAKVSDFAQALSARGVITQLSRAVAPGSLPMQQLGKDTSGRSREQTAQQRADHARSKDQY